jgi:DNA repair exonuclease SbcCD ATPase subunit
MKKIILGCLCLGVLASCNVKNSNEYKALEAERDSLLQLNSAGNAEISDLMSIINEVEENFSQIKEAEKYLTIESKTKGELSADSKTRIKDNFQMINDILKKNKEDIETLNKKLKSAGGQAGQLKQTIDRLTAELEQRSAALTELRDALATRDQQIAALTGEVEQLNVNVQDLSNKTEEQATKIKEQDKALHTGYYIFGTSKELKEAKVVTGGFISSPKILKESIDKSIFIKVDIRDVKEIPVYAKKAKVLSDQPKDSYTIAKDSNGQAVIQILDYKKFWSLGQFLIIQVD